MLPEDFLEGLHYIYFRESMAPMYQLAGFVESQTATFVILQFLFQVNLRSWKFIESLEVTYILQIMRSYSVFFRRKFQDEEKQNRIVLHLPGTQPVLTAIARQRATIVRL
jgi:hypothetical protein